MKANDDVLESYDAVVGSIDALVDKANAAGASRSVSDLCRQNARPGVASASSVRLAAHSAMSGN